MATKKEFRHFSILEHEKEEDYLRDMHKHGWKFTKVTGFGVYHYEDCEPQDVIYRLDYNKASTAQKEEYFQMFADCGWEHIQDYAGYSYFRQDAETANGHEDIFSDEDSKVAMMGRVFKGRMIPLLIIFFCYLAPQFFLHMSSGNYIAAAIMAGCLTLYIVVFTVFGIAYYRKKNK